MDDSDDSYKAASKRHKPEGTIEDEFKEELQKQTVSLEYVENEKNYYQNDSNMTILPKTVSPSNADLIVDSGLDVGSKVNAVEIFQTDTRPLTAARDTNEDILCNIGALDKGKMNRSDSGLVTDECSASTDAVNKLEIGNASAIPPVLSGDIKQTETVSLFKRNGNRPKENLKVRIYRNRLSFMSSSTEDEDGYGIEAQKGTDPANSSESKNVEQTYELEIPTSSKKLIASADKALATEENPPESEQSASNAISEMTNVNDENQERRGRGNRSARRNYRNRVIFPPSSSSSEDEEGRGNAAEIVNSSSESVDSHEGANGADSSEVDVSLGSLSSESQIFFPRHFFNHSSTDSDDESNADDAMNEQLNDSMNEELNNEQKDVIFDVLNKPKPIYAWNSTYELMRREHGLTGNGRYTLRNGMSTGFTARFYSSRHVVERIKLLHCLRKHTGCVNCLNFNRSGRMLCSGSDDLRVIIWDWAQNKPKHVYKSGHNDNIFQTKFIESGSGGFLDIVSAGRDGQVRRAFIPSSGGKVTTACLYRHRGGVHKLVVCPQNPTEIISVGEDGHIKHQDIRKEPDDSNTLKMVKANTKKIKLFSISHHPFKPEICVCGCDKFVRTFDKRNMSKTVYEMCPQKLIDLAIPPQITCSVYNSTGSEILSSYSDDHIYLFDNNVYKKGEYLHCYKGHYNYRTIKGVNFFGLNSEYIISGSDCGNIFFWDKNTEAILNFMPGDTMDVVNCLEPHPSIPVLATSGLDHNIKIWEPNSEIYPPDLSKLEDRIKRNLKRSVIEEANEADDRQFNYFIRQFLRNERSASASNDSQSQNVPESQSSSSSSEDDYTLLDGLNCRTQ